ncbi:MAG: VTT domain-containing protein [Bacteriovoracaceae bacterium]|nr:VTT domain-containing protein [Bacteriovoracaceae bacterium]
MLSEQAIFDFLVNYAYSPLMVYGFIIIFMLMSGFGFPLPEEVVLVSSGIVAYMAHHPDDYPPPYPGAMGVNVYLLSFICFFAVMLSDTVVYLLGKYRGLKIFHLIAWIKYSFYSQQKKSETSVEQIYQALLTTNTFKKINLLFDKHGALAAGIFRFTPGIRFPGHLSCGMLGVPLWKFLAVDFVVAAISVPTQVILVATFGEEIIKSFKEFKLIILSIGAAALAIYFVLKYRKKKGVEIYERSDSISK